MDKPIERPRPELKEIDRLKLERLNLSISNLRLQQELLFAPIRERLVALQREVNSCSEGREKLVKEITESYGLDGKWKLNPDTITFEPLNP